MSDISDEFLNQYGVSFINYVDVLMEFENIFAQALQTYYSTLRSDIGQKYKYSALIDAFNLLLKNVSNDYIDVYEFENILKALVKQVNHEAEISTSYLSDILIEIRSLEEMITLLNQVLQKRKINREITENDKRIEEIYTARINDNLKRKASEYRRSHELVLQALKDFIPVDRQGWWFEDDTISQFISDAGKIFHDLAVIFTNVLERKPDLVKIQDSVAMIFSRIKDIVKNPPENVSLYFSGTILNIQAGTGHTVKIRIAIDVTVIYGHIGDYSYVQDIDSRISNTGDDNEYAWKIFRAVDALAEIVNIEQKIRRNLMGEFDMIVEDLYVAEMERDSDPLIDTSDLDEELDIVVMRIVNLFKRQYTLFKQLVEVLDEPLEFSSPLDILINDNHFKDRFYAIKGFISYLEEMFKDT